jgi:enoyl-CoA hydratase
VKELAAGGREALIQVNRACYAAFASVFDCEVPVIAAVQGFCVGGGIGLVGNADIIVASDDAVFGLPEVDRGALGAATHLSRLVPGHRMRAMLYTGENAGAQELKGYGSVQEVVPPERLRHLAREIAAKIAAKHPTVIRRAKESVNGIEAVDPRASYRFEQGFTFELNLSDVPDEARRAYVEKREPDYEKKDG